MTRGIDNEETRDLVLVRSVLREAKKRKEESARVSFDLGSTRRKQAHLVNNGSLGLDSLDGEVGSSNLLSDSSSFSLLDVGLTNLSRVERKRNQRPDQLLALLLS